jgi:type IV secretory pathway TraG/TraD family ATPase VirD4
MNETATEELVAGTGLVPATGHIGAVHSPTSPLAGWVLGEGATSVGLDDGTLGKHVLFLGGIGQGKTVGMTALVESIRSQVGPDDVLVFFDTKGDWYERFYRDGDAVIARATQSQFAGQVTWNLFEELAATPADRDVEDEVFELSGTIFDGVAGAAGENNRIWSNMGRDVFAGIMTSMLRYAKRKPDWKPSNRSIRTIADEMTVEDMRKWLTPHKDLRGALAYIAKDDSNTTRSVMVFLQQALQGAFRSSFGAKGDFSIRKFLRAKSGRALFLEYDIASGEALTPVYRAMLDIAMKEAMSRSRQDGRVIFVMDEFALLPELTHLTNGLNFGRSLGLRFIVGTQNIKQVQEQYGEHMAASVLSAFGTVFSFRLFDGDSRAFVQDRFGTNKKMLRFEAAIRSRGMSEEVVDGHVVEDWDLSDLDVGQCILALPNQSPVKFRFRRPESATGT